MDTTEQISENFKINWKTIFSVSLGFNPNFGVEKKIRIIEGCGTSIRENEEKEFKIVRADIRLWKDNKAGIGVSLTNYEFQWLTKLLQLDIEHAKYNGKRVVIMDKLNDYSIVIATVENDKVYGLALSREEKNVLLKNKDIMEFLLKNYAANGSQLTLFANNLFTVHIAEYINNAIKSDCSACNGLNEHTDNSLCSKYLRTIFLEKDYLSLALNDTSLDSSFYIRFNKLTTFLNISAAFKLECMQITLPLIKLNVDGVRKDQIQFRDIGGTEANYMKDVLVEVEKIINAQTQVVDSL